MKRIATPLLVLTLLSACAPLSGGGRGGPPGDDGGAANNRRSANTTAVTDQQQVLLGETAAELKLTPRQLVLWERYQERVGALMADQLRPASSPSHGQSALQQIDSRVATVRGRLAAIEEVQDAAAALYAALASEQQKIADQRLAATVPALYSGLITCFTPESTRDKPGSPGGPGGPGGSPPRR